MGIEGMSKSEVSRFAAKLDTVVTQFKERPLDRGPYRYLWIDALTQRVREGGRVVNVAAVIATAVNNEGTREIIDFDIATTEDTAAWTAFLCSLGDSGGFCTPVLVEFAYPFWSFCTPTKVRFGETAHVLEHPGVTTLA